MAMLLALSASPEELEVAMISVTYGNVPLQRYCQPPFHEGDFFI
jgi:inosine-uridine nucleoside N-ribohydrolase